MSHLRPATLLLAALLSLAAPPARAQLVNDGQTNVLSNATNTVPTGVTVGTNGVQSTYIVTNGALLRHSGDAYIGLNATSSSNRVIIAGAGSRWSFNTTMGDLSVGAAGWGNQLVVSDGGWASQLAGVTYIGRDSTASNNEIVVRGNGSFFGSLGSAVGYAGSGNCLTISDGGAVQNQQVLVGGLAGSSGNVLSVNGTNARLSATAVRVGNGGSDNRMVISNGGFVVSVFGYLGTETNSDRNLAVITGVGTMWSNLGALYVGHAGSVNSLQVLDGGTVTATNLIVGHLESSTANRVLVDGGFLLVTNIDRTATLDVRRGTNVFNSGIIEADQLLLTNTAGAFVFNGGTLVTRGAIISNEQDFIVGNNPGYGPATWDVRSNAVPTSVGYYSLFIGHGAANATLLITNGATVTDGYGYVGYGAAAVSNSVRVTGPGSTWTNEGKLYVGYSGSFNSLFIGDGGKVDNDNGYIGYNQGADSNAVTVSGPGSRWNIAGPSVNNAGYLHIGFNGAGNSLSITAGGTVSNNQYAQVGLFASASNNSVLVSGAGSTWINKEYLAVGYYGSDNQLSILNGGHVSSYLGTIGQNSLQTPGAGARNAVIVSGPGSTWSNQNAVGIGESGAFNTLLITNGGSVNSIAGYLGLNTMANSNAVIVAGQNSSWTSGFELDIGWAGSFNKVQVTEGGQVTVSSVYLGGREGSVGNQARVSGSNSLLVGGGEFVVGKSGSSNALLISDGGAVQAGSVVVGWAASASNNLLGLAGGTLTIGAGLTINSNNALTGSGTINGAVTNRGTISPGNSPGSLTINGSLFLGTSSLMSFELGGLLPTNQYDVVTVTNFVEFAGTLSLSLLNNYLPRSTDSFALMSFASSSGSFTNVSSGRVSLTNNLASFAVTLGATNLVLSGVQYADSDGDGQGDLQEQAAGTNPNDPASALAILSVTMNGAGHGVVRFQSVPGKSYRVEYSDNFTTWSAAIGAAFTNPSPGVSEWVDDGTLTGGLTGAGRAYRIGLQ